MSQLSETNYSSIKVPPNLITLTQQHEGTNNPTIHYLNKNPNVIMKNNKLIKAIAGFSHVLCLFNNGDIFTNIHNEINNTVNNNEENKEEEDSIIRGEVGTNTIDFHQPTITNMYQLNDDILQNVQITNIFTKCAFTIYLGINKLTKKQTVLASGWNSNGCCSCKSNEMIIKEITMCSFIQFPQNNNFLEDKSTEYLQNETILNLFCGGNILHMLTENNETKEHFIYECGDGENSLQLTLNKNISVLRKSLVWSNFLKENDGINFKVKKIESLFFTAVVTENKIYSLSIYEIPIEIDLTLFFDTFDKELRKILFYLNENRTEYNFYLAGDQFLTLILDRINNGEDEEMKFKRKLISCVTDMELKFK